MMHTHTQTNTVKHVYKLHLIDLNPLSKDKKKYKQQQQSV